MVSVLILLGLAPLPARAGLIFEIAANTTAIQGVSGSFDLEYNPGGVGTLAATATITNFLTDGTGLSLNTTDGDVSGSLLPGPLTINNTFALNDFLENITFGTNIDFTVTLSGPGVSSPDSTLPGSSFGFTLYDSSFNSLLTIDPAGTVVTINLNPDGSTTVSTFPSDESGGAPAGDASQQLVVVPEPSSVIIFSIGLFGIAAYALARRGSENVERVDG